MKLIITLSIILLVACKSNSSIQAVLMPEPKVSNVKNQMYKGIIQKSNATMYENATHILVGHLLNGDAYYNIGKQSIIALKSNNINLNNFISEKVIIIGAKIDSFPIENGPDFIEVTSIEKDKMVKIE